VSVDGGEVPYYYKDDHVTIYHGDCLEIMPTLTFDVVVTDPPYGLSLNMSNRSRKRGALATANDYPDVIGDDQPFDPEPFLSLGVPLVLFGGNHFGSRLPDSPTWLVWDKLDGLTSKREIGFNDQADCELAWSNLGGPARIFSHRWMGAMKAGRDARTKRRHPTEKPVELMTWVILQVPDGVILDPYMGSGTTLRAAKDLGCKAIGIELEERYCEIAANRCAQEVLDLKRALS